MTIRKTIKDKSQDKNRISHLGQIHEEVSAYCEKLKQSFKIPYLCTQLKKKCWFYLTFMPEISQVVQVKISVDSLI